MNTTIYLIRHSTRLSTQRIDEYNNNDSSTLKREKIILSVSGEKRAETLANEAELQNIDKIYASNCVRTLQTAKYMMEKQNLNITIDKRFDERVIGQSNNNSVPNWFTKQFIDENYKTICGESQKEVQLRMFDGLSEVLHNNQGKRIAIFSHGIAISFLLLKWCKLINVNENKEITLEFNNKIIYNKRLNSPEVFKLLFDEKNNPISITYIPFNDIKFDDFELHEK